MSCIRFYGSFGTALSRRSNFSNFNSFRITNNAIGRRFIQISTIPDLRISNWTQEEMALKKNIEMFYERKQIGELSELFLRAMRQLNLRNEDLFRFVLILLKNHKKRDTINEIYYHLDKYNIPVHGIRLWNLLLFGFTRSMITANTIFQQIETLKKQNLCAGPDFVTYSLRLEAVSYDQPRSFSHLEQSFAAITKAGHRHNNWNYNVMLAGNSRAKSMKKVWEIFDQLKQEERKIRIGSLSPPQHQEKETQPYFFLSDLKKSYLMSDRTWSIIIDACGMHGDVLLIPSLLKKMESVWGMPPNTIHYDSAIEAFLRYNLLRETGHIFLQMKLKNIPITASIACTFLSKLKPSLISAKSLQEQCSALKKRFQRKLSGQSDLTEEDLFLFKQFASQFVTV